MRLSIKRLAGLALPPILSILAAAPASGQICIPGELRAFVVDPQGSPMFDANVRIGAEGAPIAERPTRTLGVADFEKVPCGGWKVTAVKEGFESAGRTVQIASAANVEITLELTISAQKSSLDVTATAPTVAQSASQTNELRPSDVKTLPLNPATVADALPLVPGVVRTPDGELKIDGSGEHRSALIVNQTDVTDPATGKFGQTIPVDSIETVTVLNTPFLAQYGRFTAGVVAVETRRGGEKWHAELNDPFPDFRIRSWHMRGIRNETPRGVLGGPIIRERLYINTALQYYFQRETTRTLPFPVNESKQEWVNSFTQIDLIISPKQIVNATFHFSPQHINFANLDYFNPQPATPSFAQHNYVGTAADHFGLLGGILDSSLSFQRFNVFIGAQGSADMVITPEGTRGNYFGGQNRAARRTEWLETWSPVPVRLAGTHLVKIGTSLTGSGDDGQFTYRPVDVLDSTGRRLQRIDFTNRAPFSRTDLEFTVFAQDHWALNSKVAFDYGGRFEHQRLPSSVRIAPRAGVAWTPFSDEQTVFRAGYGQFYDHLPLDIYTFGRYPERIITNYAPDGGVPVSPMQFANVIGNISGPRSFLVNGQRVAGGFAPRGATWNVQAEHAFSRLLRIRGVYTDNRSVGLVEFEPEILGTANEIVLNGDGRARYRRAEITAKFAWRDDQQLVLSYTRSRAEGNLNSFDTFLGNFPGPLIHPDAYSNMAADLPNRFLMWGRLKFPLWTFQILPIVEYRNGFPYARFDERQNYSGIPNSDGSRFPNFFSADARFLKDFKVHPKYTARLSLTCFNLSNHFNALAVHANIADPQYGVFFGNYRRRYRGDFEVIF
ncbi:MAG: TonB-dependent receptor [Bryobacteraceae bacterium]